MFGRKSKPQEIRGEITDTHDDMNGKVLTNIKQKGNTMELVIRSRVDGSVLFKAEYQTKATGRSALYTAERLTNVYIAEHGLYEDVKISNIDDGHFRMATKRTR